LLASGTGGTHRWAPPELLDVAFHALSHEDRKLETDFAVDVYSFGCVLGELVTGLPPYAGHRLRTVGEGSHRPSGGRQ
jgi:serine/threonine protein kinase